MADRRQLTWTAFYGAALVVLAIAAFARFSDLGGAPLADDEYYTTRSIEWILTDGVPVIPSGGYYVRGPMFQYAAAGLAWLLGEDNFAYRLTSAICGLLVGVLGFFYARRFGGPAIGLAVAAALLLSSWSIEYGRLVRFYTLFQLAALVFLFALDRAYFEARAGWRFIPHLALVAAAFAHELAVLLTLLLFLPLLPQCTNLRLDNPRHRTTFTAISLLTAFIVVFVNVGLDLRNMGVADRYPDDMVTPGGLRGPFAAPILPFFRLSASPILHLAAIGLVAAILAAAFVLARWRGVRRFELPDLFLGLALLAALFHLFAAMGLVLLWAFARYDLWQIGKQPPRRLALMAAIVVVVIVWLAITAMAPGRLITEGLLARWNITDPTSTGAILRALWSTFFGWPDFYRSTLRAFATEFPELGLALIGALIWFVVAHRHDDLADLLRHPAMLVVYWAVITALFLVGSSTVRYWFPLLPVIYTLFAVTLAEMLTRWRPQAKIMMQRWASLAFIVLFALSPDFQPRHLMDVGNDAVRFRTGPFARFIETWYPRFDVRGAAEAVERLHAEKPEVRIVVDALPALSYYLDAEHAVYLERTRSRFRNVSREKGTLDLWSDRYLMSTPEELLAYVDNNEELWLVHGTEAPRLGTALATLPQGRLVETGREILGQDRRIELIRLRPTVTH